MKRHYMEGLPFRLLPRDGKRQRLLEKAQGGDLDAALDVSTMLLAGDGGAPEPQRACETLQPFADKGSAEAQLMLGGILFTIPGCESEGVAWLRKAAEAGLMEAVYLVGVACARGQGVPADREAARRHLRRAAQGGIAEAVLELEQLAR
jgi:TPR repeat protein